MNLKEQFKISWTFLVATIIFVLIVLFRTKDIYNVNDVILGIAFILLAVTVTYTCINVAGKFQRKGRYNTSMRFMYAAGLLSGLWLYEAIKYLF